jgi:hypothetical protein
MYVRARIGHASLSQGVLQDEWGEEPELFYILGPLRTHAWIVQVSNESKKKFNNIYFSENQKLTEIFKSIMKAI